MFTFEKIMALILFIEILAIPALIASGIDEMIVTEVQNEEPM